jgi:hypothetical protein
LALEEEVQKYGAIYLSGPADRETLVARTVQVLADAAV